MSNRIQATFVSVWDNGIEITLSARFDPETGILDEVQMAELPDGVVEFLEALTGEYVRFGNQQYELEYNGDGTYSAIRPYGVFFFRSGYAQVMATSAEKARTIADEKLTYDEVSWDDDWPVTDVQPEF